LARWLALGLLLALGGWARADAAAEAIFQKVRALNPGLQDSQAQVDLTLRAVLLVVPYQARVRGKYYFKRPDMHKLEATEAPDYIKRYPQAFGFSLPRLERFASTVLGPETLAREPVWHLRLLPREPMGDVEAIELWIHRDLHTVLRHVTFYKAQGRLAVDLEWRRTQSFLVIDRMRGAFDFPSVGLKATAAGRYSDYRFNQGLPDSLFQPPEAYAGPPTPGWDRLAVQAAQAEAQPHRGLEEGERPGSLLPLWGRP
jgi:hypothetical protein